MTARRRVRFIGRRDATTAAEALPPLVRGTVRQFGLRRGLKGVVTLLAMALGAGFAWFVEAASFAPAPLPEVEGIAVLTGGPDRVETGLRLALERPGARVIVSGVGRDADLAALSRMAGVEPWGLIGRIALGRQARSTRDNAAEVANWAGNGGIGSLAVVTAGFHMPRALLELRRTLPHAALHPVPVEPRRARAPAMLREYAKLVGAWLGLSELTAGLAKPDQTELSPAATGIDADRH